MMVAARIDAPDDYEGWADRARRLLRAGIAPDQVVWCDGGSAAADLFSPDEPIPPPLPDTRPPRANRALIAMARTAILHSDPGRLALLYRLIWRSQRQESLMRDATDADVRRLALLDRAVRRDLHKMRAFLRFREVRDADGGALHLAWFEPVHHILRANAAFFVNRFAAMRWSILTPRGSIAWDGERLSEGPPVQRPDVSGEDDVGDLWQAYYAATFNPARLKLDAMRKEMPRRYWKHMPETALIPDLVAHARAREAAMVDQGSTGTERPSCETLAEVGAAILACRECPIGCNGTRAVMGEGPKRSTLMIVGEQPGDMEEQAGRPFVGPAGRLLDAAMTTAGLKRGSHYMTNAVKHFKYEPRGKRRIHQTPTAREIDHCRWWLDNERAIVRPKIILALGASAARGLLGKTVSIARTRGEAHRLPEGEELWIAPHPSYLLRLDGEARDREAKRFAADLRRVAERLAALR